MIKSSAFTVEDWCVREKKLNLDILAQTESIFALSNGYLGLRGNLDEGEPHGLPGTYLNSVYEQHPLPHTERAYGYPESSQEIINVTNDKIIRLLVNDEPFDIRYGEVQSHEQELDFRHGLLHRCTNWVSLTGSGVKVSSVRMVSFTQRSIAAISYTVEPLNTPIRVIVQSELVTNEDLPDPVNDPRVGIVTTLPLVSEEHMAHNTLGIMLHRTQTSGLLIGAAMDHLVDGPAGTVVESESTADVARVSIAAQLKPGEQLHFVKFIAYGWSGKRTRPALRDQVAAALTAARLTGWEGLLAEQHDYLGKFWKWADIEIDGDPEIQQAVRFALFHVLQAGSRGESRPIPAKGLTGSGYEGHAFWDTEIIVLPMMTMTFPHAAADALCWRHSILDQARKRAQQLGLKGAAFPWRTIQGEECSGYWPASTAAFHINADIAYAVTHYVWCTNDTRFEENVGLELLVETAKLWFSLGYFDSTNHFRIDGITGPDEYSAVSDNNVYTNLMAQHNLRAAANCVKRYPDAASALDIRTGEIEGWQEAAEKMFIPYDERLAVTPQDETFTKHEVWDFESTAPHQYPLFQHFTYFDLYRKQVIKQADLVLAMHICGHAFTAEQKARNFSYYEPLTVRDSSLSASTQTIMAAEVGQLKLAYQYLNEAAFMDLADLENNVQDGIHIASLAGSWAALVAGFGGMRSLGNLLSCSPRLPDDIKRLAFHIIFRGSRLRVEVTAHEATYHILNGSSFNILHHGEEITLPLNEPVTRPIPDIQVCTRPTQPAGRAPLDRTLH